MFCIICIHLVIGFQSVLRVYSIIKMATLTFKPYVPKPLEGNIRKPVSKSITRQPSFFDKSFQINSNNVPIKVLSYVVCDGHVISALTIYAA